jgi:hypothetical protein
VIVTRMYAGSEGVSHFQDLKVPSRLSEVGDVSRWFPTSNVLFREVPEGLFLDWHLADNRVFIAILKGRIEVTLGDGSVRQFGPGDIVFAEDQTGSGHQTRDIEGPRLSLMIKVPDDFSVEGWEPA